MFEENLNQLKTKVEAMILASRIPMVFLDLDDTLNRRFGAPIEAKAVTLLLNPERRGNLVVGSGYEATIQYLECLTEVLQHESYAQHVKALRSALMLAVANKLNLPVLPTRLYQLWTFEHPIQQAESHQVVLIRVKGPGIVHVGVNRDGKWIRIYDVPLKEVSPGVWEAYVLDPEVDEFTFIWYDPKGAGNVHWEGKNYLLQRLPGS